MSGYKPPTPFDPGHATYTPLQTPSGLIVSYNIVFTCVGFMINSGQLEKILSHSIVFTCVSLRLGQVSHEHCLHMCRCYGWGMSVGNIVFTCVGLRLGQVSREHYLHMWRCYGWGRSFGNNCALKHCLHMCKFKAGAGQSGKIVS